MILIAWLVFGVAITAIIAWATNEADKRRTAERTRLIAIIVAQDVSPQAAVAVASKSIERPKPETERRIHPIGL